MNTHTVPDGGRNCNVWLRSFPLEYAHSQEYESAAQEPRALLGASRPIRAGEELLLSYGIDARHEPAQQFLHKFGILTNYDDQFLPGAVPAGADGEPAVKPLWCFVGSSYDRVTGVVPPPEVTGGPPQVAAAIEARLAGKSPITVRGADLGSGEDSPSSWKSSTVEEDERALMAARHALASGGDQPGADSTEQLLDRRRRVLALEFRLGCKFGAKSVLKQIRSERWAHPSESTGTSTAPHVATEPERFESFDAQPAPSQPPFRAPQQPARGSLNQAAAGGGAGGDEFAFAPDENDDGTEDEV